MSKDKVRVYELARSLNLKSKELLDLCRQANIPVQNQLSSLDAEQQEAIEKLLHRKSAPAAAPRESAPAAVAAAPAAKAPAAPPPPSTPQTGTAVAPPPVTPPRPAVPVLPTRPIRDLNQLRRQSSPSGTQAGSSPGGGAEKEARPRQEQPRVPRILRPSGTVTPPAALAPPPKPKPPPATKEEKKGEGPTLKPAVKLTPDQLARITQGQLKPTEITRVLTGKPLPPKSEEIVVPPLPEEEDEEGTGDRRRRPGAVTGRDERHKRRTEQAKRRREQDEELNLLRTLEDDDSPAARLRRQRQKQVQRQLGTQPRKGKIPVEPPITVRTLSEALGIRAPDLLRKLMEHGRMANINAELSIEEAQLLALDFGCELEVKKPLDPEEQLLEQLKVEDKPEDLVPRAPIVTVMGHVDHGKTSLLDRIRESDVVSTEAGGITQHLRAWRVEHSGRPITFLDTPGHEAFTEMRARGAQVTDIVVLVVAADDGVMPQTEEAISHARAAGVPIVVAINKVDLPNANLNKTRQQLYSLGLVPDTMGGDTPFVETVATPGRARGINELLDMISLVAELKELKANPNRPAVGTCLEAKLTENEGVVATLLVQNGTLHRGDVILCGASYGRVRAMYDDHGRHIESAGPSVPVRVTGLDEPPDAGDKFQVVPDLSLAREVAEKRRERKRVISDFKPATFRLEDLGKKKVVELKIILKADVRGSIEAIKKEMEKLTHEEVRLKLLHAGVGAITEGDVTLALASPEDTLIIGFNVVPDERARALAEAKGVQIRHYDIIYNLTDDLKAALQGKLKPREEVVPLGRAVVRQTFKVPRVGTVAGCHVTQGVIERNARVRVIRDGVVIYPPPDRVATLESLKRFKDDVREVREGYDCGMKIAGYDNVKEGDVIEAFRVVEVQRTL
ncbi:MAG: translation initiation factor IF-2 [Gemmatales bacterium]|nr:translation initiation factor IF-2 [Gemmatales bacterium]MDW8387823.1 translation initiation factor IF-2 [Gemmatales bacterium]